MDNMNKALQLVGNCARTQEALATVDFTQTKAIAINFFHNAENGAVPAISLVLKKDVETEFEKQLWSVFEPILMEITEEYYKAMCAVVEQITNEIRESEKP